MNKTEFLHLIEDDDVKINTPIDVELDDRSIVKVIPKLDKAPDIDTLPASPDKLKAPLMPTLVDVPEYESWTKSNAHVKQSKYTHKQYQAVRRKKNKQRRRNRR